MGSLCADTARVLCIYLVSSALQANASHGMLTQPDACGQARAAHELLERSA